MSWPGEKPLVRLLDGFGNPASLDSFARLRVSNPVTLVAGKQTFDDLPLTFDNFTSGTGGTAYDATQARTELTAGNGGVGVAARSSHLSANYQPGKSQFILVTFQAESSLVQTANAIGRVGYYDFVFGDGLFFRVLGGSPPTLQFQRIGAGSTDTKSQNEWNLDRLDGTGPNGNNPSGLTLDVDGKSQILFISMEWLGVGSVVMGWIIGGQIVPAHRFDFANETPAAGQSVYMSTPNCALYWDVEATADLGLDAQLNTICGTIKSEGGEDPVGLFRSANRGATAANAKTINAGVLEQLIAIRLKSGNYSRAPVVASDFSALTLTQGEFLWEIRRNPTVGGAAAWQSVANSAVEYDVALTAAGSRIVSGGTVIASGYAAGSNANSGVTQSILQALNTRLGSNPFTGARDTIVLAASPIGAAEDFFGSLGWFEFS